VIAANVLNGAVYEAEFQAEALRRGFVPHLPVVPMSWDVLVTCPSGILKVQVKGTSQMSSEPNDYSYKIMTSRGAGKKYSIKEEVDVIACWVDPRSLWYLIPQSKLKAKCVRLYADATKTRSKYQKYKEDWSLFYN
tara:strand:- start:116 stop:523 length:408 start_codon:yes stop_codon:yes gene_type:complete